MSESVVVLGAGPVGLAAAMLLAADGREVVVFEKDSAEVPATPAEAWDWERRGVAQFRQAHALHPRARQVLERELPGVLARLEALGGFRYNYLRSFPTAAVGDHRADDDRYDTVTARRPVIEAAFAQLAEETPRVRVVRGVGVEGPVLSAHPVAKSIPRVVGIRTSEGQECAATYLVDALGRRSRFPDWVRAAGGRTPEEEASDAGFAYYTRHYRSDVMPEFLRPLAFDMANMRVLTLPADNNTWTLGLVAAAGDKPFKGLRDNDTWVRVFGALPPVAHWLDGEPICDVLVMAGVLDRRRSLVLDSRPVIAGLLPVGDAWSCTNPSAGRGITLGLLHAVALRDAVRTHPDDPVRCAVEFDRLSNLHVLPWYNDQVQRDRERATRFEVLKAGGTPAPARDPLAPLMAAARFDPDAARAAFDVVGCLAPPADVLGRPGLRGRLEAFGSPPVTPPGPTRADLLALL
jgi:2-polyprenyl-6-methoxyphenol hydroxylase-like FAD-dependent oxidoreductase